MTEFKAKKEVLKELIILLNKCGHQKEPQLLIPWLTDTKILKIGNKLELHRIESGQH